MTATIAPADLRARVDELFVRWSREDSPGCALVVVRDGETVLEAGYGMADLEHGVPLTADSVFDIASSSKQFTAAAILLLADAGELSLDDDVRAYIPELPDYGTPITVRHLVHHTSGIRDYIALHHLAGRHDGDYFDMQDVLDIVLRQRRLNFTPGSEHRYSNSGYVLLAIIVTRITGISFAQWCDENMLRPLRMTRSRFREDVTTIVPDLVQSYAREDSGELRKTITNDDVVGDGGLLSSARDLALWERNYIEERVGGAGFFERMAQPGTPEDAEEEYGFGLATKEHCGVRTVSHGGNLHGFSGEFLRFPEARLGVICLSNLGGFDAPGLARRVAELFLDIATDEPPASAAIDAAPPAALDAARAAMVAGLYRWAETGAVIEVVVDDGALVALVADRRLPMAPKPDGTFAAEYQELMLEVVVDVEDGIATGLRFVVNGEDVIKARRIEPPALSVDDLSAYTGSFHSDELRIDAEATLEEGRLFLRRGGATRAAMRATLADEFGLPFGGIAFTRDTTGAIDGFLLSMSRTSAVEFSRVVPS